MPKPPEWQDTIHEGDGGNGSVWLRQQNGQHLRQQELLGMLQRIGAIKAWDEFSQKPLDLIKAAEARQADVK